MSGKRKYQKIAKDNAEITGWFEGCVVHHKDHNHGNNSIDNLQCLTKAEHCKIHMTGKITSEQTKQKLRLQRIGKPSGTKGKKRTDEQKLKISIAHLGQIPWNKGLSKPKSLSHVTSSQLVEQSHLE